MEIDGGNNQCGCGSREMEWDCDAASASCINIRCCDLCGQFYQLKKREAGASLIGGGLFLFFLHLLFCFLFSSVVDNQTDYYHDCSVKEHANVLFKLFPVLTGEPVEQKCQA